jgi:hypothetical protein
MAPSSTGATSDGEVRFAVHFCMTLSPRNHRSRRAAGTLLVLAGLSAPAVAAEPVTLLEVIGQKVGVYELGDIPTPVGIHHDKLAVSFRVIARVANVSIDVGLASVHGTVLAFLTNHLGLGTTKANQIASSTYSGRPGEHITLFQHLNLDVGTYYVVLYSTGGNSEWNRLFPSSINGVASRICCTDQFFTHDLSTYPPLASGYTHIDSARGGSLQYRLTQ